MALKITKEEAYALGRKAAETALEDRAGHGDIRTRMENHFKVAVIKYLGAASLDLRDELLNFSGERMESDLDVTKFPECRGLRELVEAERRGFADVINDPVVAAFHFDWDWFFSRRLSTRFVGSTPPRSQCTDFWFADTKEGGPIHGCNRDDLVFLYKKDFAPVPETGPEETPSPFLRITCVGGVAASVLCDEEPANLFPVNMDWITPDEITELKEYMAFMERYREFWGPGNRIYVDAEMNFASVEKANVRMGVRYSRGCAAITAGAYLTPEMRAFKKERDQVSFEVRGWTEDNPDAVYWDGCERRYRRLLDLVEKEYKNGATLIGAAQIALDHSVPFPERICLAGEKGHRKEKLQNWTIVSFSCCVAGPNRRMLYWAIDPTDPVPIYRTRCHVIPGVGLAARQTEWEQEVAQAGEIGLRNATF